MERPSLDRPLALTSISEMANDKTHDDDLPPEQRRTGGGGYGVGGYGTGGYGSSPYASTPYGGDAPAPGPTELAFDSEAFDASARPLEGPSAFPSAGTSPIFGGGQPPDPDPTFDPSQIILAPTDGDSTQPTAVVRRFERAIVVQQIRNLIEAFQEVEDYDPLRNVPPSPLWKDDKDYLGDIEVLIRELRRLNDLLDVDKTPDQAEVRERGGAVVYAAKRISDAAYDTIGKGLGAVVLGSIGLVALKIGVPVDIAGLLSAAAGGK